jgi:hypothetical protein
MNRIRRNRRAQRGAATVELAITMLLIVPIFLYALFLDDLLRYRLNQQEAVVSTAWDFTVQNYDEQLKEYDPPLDPGGKSEVQHHARLMYCDHEAGLEKYDDKDYAGQYADCSSTEHHKGTAVVAHECWLNSKAHQITCKAPDSSVGMVSDGLIGKVQSGQHPYGGMFDCSGNLVVENYLLPRTFLQEFSDTNLTKHQWQNDANAHENSEAGTDDTAWFFDKDEIAVVADSFAYAGVQKNDPGQKGSAPFWNDVNTVYTQNLLYEPFRLMSLTFGTRLVSQGLLNIAYSGPKYLRSDDPAKPNLAISPSKAPSRSVKQDNGSRSYFSSPWKDYGQNAYEKSYEARGDHYMGCKDAQSC